MLETPSLPARSEMNQPVVDYSLSSTFIPYSCNLLIIHQQKSPTSTVAIAKSSLGEMLRGMHNDEIVYLRWSNRHRLVFFTARRLAKRGICRRRVSV